MKNILYTNYANNQVLGIDEVGRGAWAGPLVAAAVILKSNLPGLKDSKLLTKAQRESLYNQIKLSSVYGIGWVWSAKIDKIGLSAAIALAMERAVSQINARYEQIIIDGSYNFLAANPKTICLVKADNVVPAVSAASVLAKVERDNYMATVTAKYPNYFFEKHVGYGTKLHRDALTKHGICKIHRKSYKPVKEFIN